MTDRPIIFSAPMVRALLDGRKTMTRRMAWKPLVNGIETEGQPTEEMRDASPWQRVRPGDRLWVRENCWTESRMNEGDGVRYPADCEWRVIQNTQAASEAWSVMDRYAHHRQPCNDTNCGQQVPSIHMPRWASRLTLTVTAVKVERLQEISEADARAEGVLYVPGHGDIEPRELAEGFANFANSRMGFEVLWNFLHGPDAWGANPEVVALSFTVEHRNIDA